MNIASGSILFCSIREVVFIIIERAKIIKIH